MIKRIYRHTLGPLVLSLSLMVGIVSSSVPLMTGLTVGALVVTQSSCGKEDVVKWSRRAVTGLERARPTLVNAGISVARLDEAISIGNQLIIAFEADNDTTAVGLMSAFINAFEGIVAETDRIGNPATRTLALALLAIVDLAIHEIADAMADEEPSLPAGMRGAPAIMTIRRYREKKRWQCRASGPLTLNDNAAKKPEYKAGQYVPMKACEKFPDNTQVETR